MYHNFPSERLRELRKKALLTLCDVYGLIGIWPHRLSEAERGIHRLQTRNFERLMNLYAARIKWIKQLEEAFALQLKTTKKSQLPPEYRDYAIKKKKEKENVRSVDLQSPERIGSADERPGPPPPSTLERRPFSESHELQGLPGRD